MTPRQFSELEAGDTGFVMLVGKPTEIMKVDWLTTGGQAYNARKAAGRNGRTSITANADIFETAEDCQAWFDATRQNYAEYVRWTRARLVIPGVNAPVVDAAHDAEQAEQADYDQTVQAAAGQWGL